jgi:hypothetical protein
MEPAKPPDKMFVPNLRHWGASLPVLKTALMVSLKAKFSACVGKYLNTLAKLPEINKSNVFKNWVIHGLNLSPSVLEQIPGPVNAVIRQSWYNTGSPGQHDGRTAFLGYGLDLNP